MSDRLNEQQEAVVNHTDGPVLVIAAPGSGKTKTLVERTVHLIQSGVSSESIMIATFTDLILRVAMAAVFSKTPLGATGIWCAWPVGWCVATVLSIVSYVTGPWKKEKIQK